MDSWVYIFSKFTPEALFLESISIFLLLSTYCAFYVLRKRKFGPVKDWVPAGLMKVHLHQLTAEADRLKAQLFGLTGMQMQGQMAFPQAGYAIPAPQSHASAGPSTRETELFTKLSLLEMKLYEQVKLFEGATGEKGKLEKEIQELRQKAQKAGSGNAADAAEIVKLSEKIKLLEARLAEYSIIEDDLANLKRLQQENGQLRSALQAAGIAQPPSLIPGSPGANAIAVGGAAMAATTAVASASAPASVAVTSTTISIPQEVRVEAPSPLEAISTPTGGGAEETSIDLSDIASLPSTEEPTVQASASGEPVSHQTSADSGQTAAAAATPENLSIDAALKSDEDLVAEFEKMLNG